MSDTLFSELETPWPILVSSQVLEDTEESDYPQSDCSFTVAMVEDSSGSHFILAISPVLQDPFLNDMIDTGKFGYRVMIRCGATNFRIAKKWEGEHQYIPIDRRLVRDSIEISLFCVAEEDIEDFGHSISSLAQHLSGSSYQIQQYGLTIFFGSSVVALDDPDSNSLKFQECFSIEEDEELQGFSFRYGTDNEEQFKVYVSPAVFRMLDDIEVEKRHTVALTSFIIPALVGFLCEESDESPLKDNENKYWTQQIIVKLKRHDLYLPEKLSADPNFALDALGKVFADQYQEYFDAQLVHNG